MYVCVYVYMHWTASVKLKISWTRWKALEWLSTSWPNFKNWPQISGWNVSVSCSSTTATCLHNCLGSFSVWFNNYCIDWNWRNLNCCIESQFRSNAEFVVTECHVPFLSSVLWHWWLGDRKGIQSEKKLDVGSLVVTIWLELCMSYSCSCHHHLHHPWLQQNPGYRYFWYQVTQNHLENGC